ncbi:MAG: hypothetical protein GY757_19990 [bacterium]|nr:hypothetical protein [bacterium]
MTCEQAAKKLQGEFLLETLARRIPVIAYSPDSAADSETNWDGKENDFFWIAPKVLLEDANEKVGAKRIDIRNIINYIFSNHPLFKYEYGNQKAQQLDKIINGRKKILISSST